MSHRVELAVAVAVASASLTPSLLPKPALLQGAVTGMAAVFGYGLGAFARWSLTPVRERLGTSVRQGVGWGLLGLAILSLFPAAWFAHAWQKELAESVGDPDPPRTNALLALMIAALLVTLLVMIARGLRALTRWAAARLAVWLPRWVAVVLAVTAVAALTAAVTRELVRDRLLASVDQSFRLVNSETSPDLPAPEDELRSGGPGSLMTWATMGLAGREFVSLPEPPGSLAPIRVYAGIDSAPDLHSRADLVVRELERTGGFRRSVVCLVVPTGTGWVDPAAVTALEALWDGDTAVASMQYSYLPSVLSLAMDQLRVDAAARALLAAVVGHVLTLPPASRPRLMLYGESLGSRGAEVAMRDVPRAGDVVDGVLLVGPMNSNPTWSDLVARRDPGSPLLAPVVEGGGSVRFWPGPEMPEYDRTDDPWPEPPSGPRTLYLQHPSDPIVWWSPSLLWSEPAWVDEREDVSRAPPLSWRPVVTFWQIAGDIVLANEVRAGHGHRYGGELVDAWAAVAPPPKG